MVMGGGGGGGLGPLTYRYHYYTNRCLRGELYSMCSNCFDFVTSNTKVRFLIMMQLFNEKVGTS